MQPGVGSIRDESNVGKLGTALDENDVRGLDVAMDESVVVKVCYGFCEAEGDFQDASGGDAAVLENSAEGVRCIRPQIRRHTVLYTPNRITT